MSERSDFFNRAVERELDRQEAAAAKYGYTVRQGASGFFIVTYRGETIAQSNLRGSAVRVAYAMTCTFAMTDPLGEALNSGDGVYRP